MTLVLLEPAAPGPEWQPFVGVRPLVELRAGIWKVRERWEAALDRDTTTIVGRHVTGFHELVEPPVVAEQALAGPTVVAAAWFAPTGAPIVLAPETPRLTHAGGTVLIEQGRKNVVFGAIVQRLLDEAARLIKL